MGEGGTNVKSWSKKPQRMSHVEEVSVDWNIIKRSFGKN
jgi:hypothetical protein